MGMENSGPDSSVPGIEVDENANVTPEELAELERLSKKIERDTAEDDDGVTLEKAARALGEKFREKGI